MTDVATYPVFLAVRDQIFHLKMECDEAIEMETDTEITIGGTDTYDGQYIVTPTEETQELHTVGLLMKHNVTVNPIPTNYGRITWNGSTITVS